GDGQMEPRRWMVFMPSPSQESDGDGATIHAQDTRDPEAEVGAWAQPPANRWERGPKRRSSGRCGQAGGASWARLGSRPWAQRRRARGTALSDVGGARSTASARLWLDPRRALQSRRDARALASRVSGEASRRLPLQPIL